MVPCCHRTDGAQVPRPSDLPACSAQPLPFFTGLRAPELKAAITGPGQLGRQPGTAFLDPGCFGVGSGNAGTIPQINPREWENGKGTSKGKMTFLGLCMELEPQPSSPSAPAGWALPSAFPLSWLLQSACPVPVASCMQPCPGAPGVGLNAEPGTDPGHPGRPTGHRRGIN